MSNKFNGFTVPKSMNPPIEQLNKESFPPKPSALNVEGSKGVEGGGNTQRDETETIDPTKSERVITSELNHQSYSAEIDTGQKTTPKLKENYNEFKQVLDIKNGEGPFCCDICNN